MQETLLLRELSDREEIRQVLARYCRGIDRLDADLIRACYHPDAHDDHGPFKGGPEAFIAWSIPELKKDLFTLHQLTTQSIELAGDVAHTESYVVAIHDRAKGDRVRRITAHARYVDRLERRDGAWRIARRLTVVESTLVEERDGRGSETGAFLTGRRDRSDPSYERS